MDENLIKTFAASGFEGIKNEAEKDDKDVFFNLELDDTTIQLFLEKIPQFSQEINTPEEKEYVISIYVIDALAHLALKF